MTLRFVSWNIENLLPALGLSTRAPRRSPTRPHAHLIEIMQRLQWPDVLCLQEVRIRPRDGEHVAAMAAALPGYVCHHALADDAMNVKFRGGRAYGVATYVRAELAPVALARPEWDREGRVVAVQLPQQGLIVINVYAVNGTDKAHFDHELGRIYEDRHAYKRRFQAGLIGYAQSLQTHGALVMLGDWNVSRAALDTYPRLRSEGPHSLARAMFNETLMPALDVVDVFRELHPERRAYTWFNRLTPPGKLDAARVDFALIARALVPHVSRAEIYEEETDRFHSDHAPLELVLADSRF